MKAAVLVEVGKELVVQERDTPRLSEGDLLVKIDLCGVCSSDLMALKGEVTDYSPPVVMGHEIAARVVESRNLNVRVGLKLTVNPMVTCGNCLYCRRDQGKYCDRLYGFGHDIDGGYAEYMSIPEEAVRAGCLIEAPEDMPPEELIFVEPLGCCLNAWRETEFRESLAVLGAGPIGMIFAKLGRRSGLHVSVFEPLPHRRGLASKVADAVFDISDEEIERFWDEVGGADTVILATNATKSIELAFKIARRGAFINLFGLFPKGSELKMELEEMHFKGFRFIASWAFSKWSLKTARDELASGSLSFKELITHTLPLDRINYALKLVERREGMKVVVKP